MGEEAALHFSQGSDDLQVIRTKLPYEVVETIQPIVAVARLIAPTTLESVGLVRLMLRSGADQTALQVDESVAFFLADLRSLVRKTDGVFLRDKTMYFLLRGANMQGSMIVQERLWDRLLWLLNNLNDAQVSCPLLASIGHNAYPDPCQKIDDLLEGPCQGVWAFDCRTRQVVSCSPLQEDLLLSGKLPVVARDVVLEPAALALQMGIPYLSLLPRKLPRRVKKLINRQLALELHCCPLGRERDTLTVAMQDPRDRAAVARLERETGLRIFPVLTHPDELELALAQLV